MSSLSDMQQRKLDRTKYMNLFMNKKDVCQFPLVCVPRRLSLGFPYQLSKEDQAQLDALEARLSYEDLLLYRRLASAYVDARYGS
jgi:hypothetical protein